MLSWQTYPELTALSRLGLKHAFSLRSPGHADGELPSLLRPSIATLGWKERGVVEAEQPHGNLVARVGAGEIGKVVPAVDALMTSEPGVVLAVRAADCGPVWFYDTRLRAVAVAHSGKKGTEKNIVGETLRAMAEAFGSDPSDLFVFLGPCIRPPHYEVDFASEIARQAARGGVGSYHDSARNTAAELGIYYSYRAEKGQTGRMWAAAMITPSRETP
ncbi:conserved hypothetical protein [Verrucomicrobium sp. GAS474]|uniref:polyphenol oxidase family protein n=1 Tax=Verrucomicrobium sp. GAS474 TaxID=1882831 RepID=UPI00087C5A39|nr:polyphenol oxidase family protein [Verrucomicrobium sp. GAS474]SDU14932.1 conserved hypothetical protein [Verrucomicrobium sp. GAS474]